MLSTCNIVKYFAFRTGTNKNAPSNYLTATNPCQAEKLNFQYVSGGPLDSQLFIAYLEGNTWLFESKSCPGYFIRVPPWF